MNSNKIKDISILIAEDEQELREYLDEYLQIFFDKVYVAKCGHEAHMIYLDKHPSIILTDINMPNIDGLSLSAKIRQRDNLTKIIIMSAHSEQEKLLNAIELNLVTYFIKPIKADLLKKVLLDTVDNIRKTSKRLYLGESIFWDKTTNTLWQNQKQIMLRQKESALLQLLCSKPNTAFSAEDIFYHLSDNNIDREFSQDSITSLVKRLRSKLPNDIIQNVYGLGYKIVSNF